MNLRDTLISLALKGESYSKLYRFYLESGSDQRYRVARHHEGIITIVDEDYPPNLKKLRKPPIVMFYRGNIHLLDKSNIVAIVGTRRATSYGISVAEKLSINLAEHGIPIISGLARGIDISAHRHVIDKGLAIAVLGNGLDVFYPFRNKDYQQAISQKGLVLSEYPYNMRGNKWTYVARNRIIAALATLVVVVETHLQGGSLYTAEFAMDMNIPVAAVPGDIFRDTSKGCNQLIADGALIITDPSDILLILGIDVYRKNSFKLVQLLRSLGGRANIFSLLPYYESTGQLMKEIALLDNQGIVRMEGSVVILLE